jgi:tetratricopeptide (TPR) repeat protein
MLCAGIACLITLACSGVKDDLPDEARQHILRSKELYEQDKLDEAIVELNKAVNLAPKHALPYVCRATVRFGKKDFDGAIRDIDDAVRLEPGKASSGYGLRGSAYTMKREYAKAVKDLEEALRLNPEDVEALNGRAWIAATCPIEKLRDGAKALAYAKQACETNKWKNPYYLGTYAAACAENGKFEEAVRWQKKALEDKDYDNRSGKNGRQMLRQFEQGKPYREQEPSKK